jgi:hypothetical protein
LAWLLSSAALALGPLVPSVARGADPQQPSFPPPEEDNGVERPPAPDQRYGHVYIMPSVGLTGPVGLAAPNVSLSTLAGLGYTFGGIVGLGIGRHATLQVFGDRTGFTSPANCHAGCSGWSYSLGLGVTYHIAQALALDPWGSFGIAYRKSVFYGVEPAAVTVDGVACQPNQLCPLGYAGIDVARIAFGGDFYPLPWLGFGPFVEVDAGANLHRATPLASTGIPLMPLPFGVTDGPRAYAYFQIGVRIAFDPMRQRVMRGSSQTGGRPRAPSDMAARSTPGPGF